MKISTRILDYLLCWSILIFITNIFDFNIIYNFVLTIFVPFLWIPIETLLIKYFKTTPGNFILGLGYPEAFTWKSAFILSCKKMCFQKTPHTLIRKTPRLIFRVLIALFMCFAIFPET